MPKLSNLASTSKRSGIREIMDLASQMEDVLHLEVGEPLFNTPSHIIDHAYKAASEGYTKYTPSAGMPSLRKAVADRLNNDYSLELNSDDVVITVGGIGAVSSSIAAITDPGDEILIPDPGWPNYRMIIASNNATIKTYPLRYERGFIPLKEDIEKEITSKTKALLINTPSNPLGVVFPEESVKELVELAKEKDIFVISDEVYEKVLFEGSHHTALSYDSDNRVIGVFSFAKTYAMTGWRIGYAVADQSIATQIAKLQEAFVSCASSVSQKAAEAALLSDQSCVDDMVRAYRANLEMARSILTKNNVEYFDPSGAFYMWIKINTEDSSDFAKKLLKEQHVAVSPGDTFGPSGKGFIRISLASPKDTIEEGLNRLINHLNKK